MNTNAQISSLIDRLSSDAAFRAHLLSEPKAVFAEYGVDIDESRIPKDRKLPSVDVLRRNFEAYKQEEDKAKEFFIFFLT